MGRLPIALLLLLGAALVLWLAFGTPTGPGQPEPALAAGGTGTGTAPDAGPAPPVAAGGPVIDAVDRRPQPPSTEPPNAWLRVSDRATGRAVADAEVRRYHGGELLGRTSAEGLAGVRLGDPEQLAVMAAGYLLRLAPTHGGSTQDEPQEVRLEPDRYTLRCGFRFLRPDGTAATAVRVRFETQRSASAPLGPRVPAALQQAGPEARRAWQEHSMIAALHTFAGMQFQLGQLNTARVFELKGEDTVFFSEGGMYQLEAVAGGDLVARALFQAEAVTEDPLVVRLVAGRHIDGQAVDRASGAPVQGATVRVKGGDPLGLESVTDASGRFRIGPFPTASFTLEVRHAEMETALSGPVMPGGGVAVVPMARLPEATLRGRVRVRPRLTPVAGATVTAIDVTSLSASATTDAQGNFSLRSSGSDLLRLSVTAPGMTTHRELVRAEGQHLDFDLWPADPEVRVREGLTAMLAGVVVDTDGKPKAGLPVRWMPDQPQMPQGIAGRRILEGTAPPLTFSVSSAEDGTFRLETQHHGSGTLTVVDGASTPDQGLKTAVSLGQTLSGLRLEARDRR